MCEAPDTQTHRHSDRHTGTQTHRHTQRALSIGPCGTHMLVSRKEKGVLCSMGGNQRHNSAAVSRKAKASMHHPSVCTREIFACWHRASEAEVHMNVCVCVFMCVSLSIPADVTAACHLQLSAPVRFCCRALCYCQRVIVSDGNHKHLKTQ